jgi:trehalose synthase
VERVRVTVLRPERFREILPEGAFGGFDHAMRRGRAILRGRRLWHINSTEKGGGVAEMLRPMLGYQLGAGWDAGWLVVDGDEDFFRVTKRLHNHLHGDMGDGDLDVEERAAYQRGLARDAEAVTAAIESGDVVILHDPQTLGLAPRLRAAGATPIWICHVGIDEPNDVARGAWAFLGSYLEHADAYVFSRSSYVWEGIDEERMRVIAPAIDALSPKNQPLGPEAAADILRAAGVLEDRPAADPSFVLPEGGRGRITERADVVQDAHLPASAPIVLQVSRWDRLKDHAGVLCGFAEHVPPELGAHLVLAGPRAEGVSDDPEQADVLDELRRTRDGLDPDVRTRTHIARLPMGDLEASDAIVNALQRRASVIVQKSLAEGFGLTVSEGMWKARPLVASRVGGIQDQILDGQSGVLIDDPTALDAFGRAVTRLLEDREAADALGEAAHERVRDHFLLPRYLVQLTELLDDVVGRDVARSA